MKTCFKIFIIIIPMIALAALLQSGKIMLIKMSGDADEWLQTIFYYINPGALILTVGALLIAVIYFFVDLYNNKQKK